MTPPAIRDDDGVDISHLIDLSDAGSWAEILPFCINIKILNDTGGDSPDGLATPVSGFIPFHTPNNTNKEQNNRGA